MIDAQTGQVTIGRFVVTRDLQRDDFVSSAFYASGYETSPQQGWYIANAKSQRDKGDEFAINLLFKGQRLAAVHIARADAAFGTDWSNWSQKAELARKLAHDVLLEHDLGNARDFAWGSVESVFDAKGGGSLIVIRYS